MIYKYPPFFQIVSQFVKSFSSRVVSSLVSNPKSFRLLPT